MIDRRKLKIWIISTCAVLAAFVLFKIFANTGNIRVSKTNYQDSNIYTTDSNYGAIGPAKVGSITQARFEKYNKKTRKLERVVGFEKVLHTSGDMWDLEKPFMSVYQENIRCDITADKGYVQVENLQGSSPSPKEAVLKGNVVVHILGQGKRTDSFIYLKEVAFDDDRSMLWSNEDVNFVSGEADLLGKGMEIVYNNATSRMEFLKIKKVDYLNIKEPSKEPAAETIVKHEPNKPAETNTPAVAANDESKDEDKKVKTHNEDYRCIFRDNVRIEYEEEVVLANEISVSNLVMAQNKDKISKSKDKKQLTEKNSKSADANSKPENKIAKQSKPKDAKPVNNWIKGKNVIATVRCDGPMIIRPVDAKEYEDWKPEKFKSFNQFDKNLLDSLGQRNLLIAETIDYNAANDTAITKGQVELVFYPQVQMDNGKQKVPFVISSDEGAEFSVPNKQAIFYTNVKGSFVKQTVNFNEENVFYGSKLIADFTEKQDSNAVMASSDISHISILGPNVRLESLRTKGDTKLSHVRLKSERMDYDRTTQDIVTSGQGKIEYANTSPIPRGTMPKSKLDKPCYALVEGFTKMVWDTNTMHIRATSEKTAGIHIGYLPIEATGKYGARTTIDTKQIDVDYNEPAAGKSQMTKLVCSGGIVYHELGANEFAGKELIYNPIEEYMKIGGSDEMPCMLNGAFVKGIEYNLKTGEANPITPVGVGIMPVREK
jgi:hypothetical protein